MSQFFDQVELIHEHVSIYDLIDMSPRPVKYETREVECQIACPFHGRDIHKSARVYPQTNSIHCWACARSWDVIDYWAQANEMWTDEGRLDVKKAVRDLGIKFKLRSKRPSWQVKLHKSLAKFEEQRAGFAQAPDRVRQRLKVFYSKRLADNLRELDPDVKKEKWELVASVWDGLDNLNLNTSSWKDDLGEWDRAARAELLDGAD